MLQKLYDLQSLKYQSSGPSRKFASLCFNPCIYSSHPPIPPHPILSHPTHPTSSHTIFSLALRTLLQQSFLIAYVSVIFLSIRPFLSTRTVIVYPRLKKMCCPYVSHEVPLWSVSPMTPALLMPWSTVSSVLDLLAALCAVLTVVPPPWNSPLARFPDVALSQSLSPPWPPRLGPLGRFLLASPIFRCGCAPAPFPGYSLPLGSHPVTHMPTAPDV